MTLSYWWNIHSLNIGGWNPTPKGLYAIFLFAVIILLSIGRGMKK